MNKLVALQKPGGTRDAVGAKVTTWSTVAWAYASIEELSGREAMIAAQREAESTVLIRLRFAEVYAGVTEAWRVIGGQECTADATADTLTTPGPRAWAVSDEIAPMAVGGALPAPLAAGTIYYIKTAANGVYTLAATAGGATIDLTDAGSGTLFIAPRIFTIDRPPRNVAEANRVLELTCSEGVRTE